MESDSSAAASRDRSGSEAASKKAEYVSTLGVDLPSLDWGGGNDKERLEECWQAGADFDPPTEAEMHGRNQRKGSAASKKADVASRCRERSSVSQKSRVGRRRLSRQRSSRHASPRWTLRCITSSSSKTRRSGSANIRRSKMLLSTTTSTLRRIIGMRLPVPGNRDVCTA